MHLLDKMKHIAATTVTVLAIGAISSTGLNVKAAEIETKTETYNHGVYEVGSNISVSNATNLKINGKKYTKGSIKKKIKTIQTQKNSYVIKNQAPYIEYYDSNNITDREDYQQQTQENYKNIYLHDFQLTFLKTGKYTISYDTYEMNDEGEAAVEYKYVKNADGISYTVTPVLKKTTVKHTYKVLNTTNPIKSVKLGKTKITYSTKKANSGAKTTYKKTIKNRYLKGKSGKLVFTMSDKKTYKFTNALVVTRGADGVLAFNVVGNKSKIAYSTGIYSNTTTYDKINQDANGDVINPTTGEHIKTTVPTGSVTGKYKDTEVYYGYKNKFTGDYLSYAVTPTTVYVHRKETSSTNSYVAYDKATGKAIMDPVSATIITRTYPQQVVKYDVATGTVSYKTVEVVQQKVVLASDKTTSSHSEFYTDAEGNNYDYSGSWKTISKDGIPTQIINAKGKIESNVAYEMAFNVSSSYAGIWVADNEHNIYDCYKDNEGHTVTCWTYDAEGKSTRWVYKYTRDTEGERVEIQKNYVDGLGSQLDNLIIFEAK